MSQAEITSITLREVNCESRRQRILDSARRLIGNEGLSAVTMRRLARDAGLSVTTLYNLIGSRDKIVAAVVGDAIDRIDDVLAREAPLDDPLEHCRAIVTVSIAYMIENEDLFRPLAREIVDPSADDSLDDAISTNFRIANRAAGMQARAIREAISQGLLIDLLDPDCLGSQIYHGWEAAFFQWGRGLLSESEFRARALYGLYVALLGVAADPVRPMIASHLRNLDRELLSTHIPTQIATRLSTDPLDDA